MKSRLLGVLRYAFAFVCLVGMVFPEDKGITIQVQNAGTTVGTYKKFFKLNLVNSGCAVNNTTGALDCTFAAPGTVALSGLSDPNANKAFTMAANTLNFNFTGNYGASWAASVSSSIAAAGATGYLFEVNTGSADNAIASFCSLGTACINIDKTGAMTASGGASIAATSMTGNAATATSLQTARAINGVNFDGTAAITVPVNNTDDNATAATMFPLWTATAGGNFAAQVSSTKLTFNPSTGVHSSTIYNAATGFRIGGAAASGNVLRGNGTNFVSAQLAYSDLSGTPTLPANTTSTAHQFFTAYNSTTGAFTKAQLACGDLSDATACNMSTTAGGDLSGTLPSPTVAKVNGVAYSSLPATDTVPVITAANTATYKAVNNCGDSTHALSYNTATHAFGCQAITASAAAGGSNTQIQYNNLGALAGDACTTDGAGNMTCASFSTSGSSADSYTEVAAPLTPSAGTGSVWFDSTQHQLESKNSSGTVATMIVPTNSGSNQFLSGVSAAGVLTYTQPVWNGVGNPTGNQSLSMGSNLTNWSWTTQSAPATTDVTWTAAADSGVSTTSIFSFLDTTGNTRTGALLDVHTVGTSTAKPLQVTAQGTSNGIQMDTSGKIQAIGTGGVAAAAISGTITTGQGGTGQTSFASNGILYGNGSNAIAVTSAGGAGTLCLQETNGGVPVFGSCAGTPATAWDSLTAPAGNLSLAMGTHASAFSWSTAASPSTTDFTWTAAADSGTSTTSIFIFDDTTANTRTGALVDIHSVGTSTALPVQITAQGTANGVKMDTAGLLQAIGTGGIKATTTSLSISTSAPLGGGGAFTGNLTLTCATCTTNASALTSNAVVLGAGSQATKVVAGITTDGASALNLGVAGASVGGIVLANATSGTITINPVTGALGSVTLSVPARTATFGTTTGTLTSGNLADFDASGNLIDSAVVAANVTTQTSNGAANQVCTYTGANKTCVPGTVTGAMMTNATVMATQLAAQYSKGACTEVWGGTGASNALQAGDDAISNNTCYNDSGVTRTITAVKCRSDNASNTTTVNPTFGSAGTGTTILTGALTCGSSYAYSASGTLSSTSWTTGTGIDPGMGGTLTGTSIGLIIEYTY